jgi:hypothetical protein
MDQFSWMWVSFVTVFGYGSVNQSLRRCSVTRHGTSRVLFESGGISSLRCLDSGMRSRLHANICVLDNMQHVRTHAYNPSEISLACARALTCVWVCVCACVRVMHIPLSFACTNVSMFIRVLASILAHTHACAGVRTHAGTRIRKRTRTWNGCQEMPFYVCLFSLSCSHDFRACPFLNFR